METLYSKIGPERLQLVLDHFYDMIFDESSISHLFKGDKDEIKTKQFMFLTQFLGGPQLYSQKFGHPKMRMRHLPHAIDDAARVEWLRCMRSAIDKTFVEDKDLGDALYNCFPQLAEHMVNR